MVDLVKRNSPTGMLSGSMVYHFTFFAGELAETGPPKLIGFSNGRDTWWSITNYQQLLSLGLSFDTSTGNVGGFVYPSKPLDPNQNFRFKITATTIPRQSAHREQRPFKDIVMGAGTADPDCQHVTLEIAIKIIEKQRLDNIRYEWADASLVSVKEGGGGIFQVFASGGGGEEKMPSYRLYLGHWCCLVPRWGKLMRAVFARARTVEFSLLEPRMGLPSGLKFCKTSGAVYGIPCGLKEATGLLQNCVVKMTIDHTHITVGTRGPFFRGFHHETPFQLWTFATRRPFSCVPRRISDACVSLTYLPRISCVSPVSHKCCVERCGREDV